jgi:hypothetical protein
VPDKPRYGGEAIWRCIVVQKSMTSNLLYCRSTWKVRLYIPSPTSLCDELKTTLGYRWKATGIPQLKSPGPPILISTICDDVFATAEAWKR